MTTETTTPDPQAVLSLPLDPDNDSGATTVRGYLIKLLETLWREQEGFSGKRPFGNSGWDYDLMIPLVKAGFIRGTFDEDGYVEELDDEAGAAIILAAIKALGVTTDMPLWVTATLADRKARKLIESWEPVPGRGIVVVGVGVEVELRSEHDAELFLAGLSSALTAFHDGEAQR